MKNPAQLRTLHVRIRGSESDPVSSGELQIQEWSARERLQRALKWGGGCWGLAVASVFVPLAHFVLVPGLLLSGPFVALVVYSKESVILGGQGTCPHCRATLPIVRGTPKFPLRDLCTQCQSSVLIEAPDASA